MPSRRATRKLLFNLVLVYASLRRGAESFGYWPRMGGTGRIWSIGLAAIGPARSRGQSASPRIRRASLKARSYIGCDDNVAAPQGRGKPCSHGYERRYGRGLPASCVTRPSPGTCEPKGTRVHWRDSVLCYAYVRRARRRRREFAMTEMELMAMAAPASIGLRNPYSPRTHCRLSGTPPS